MEGTAGPEALILTGPEPTVTGCGFLLGGRLVITMSYVIRESSDVRIRLRGMDQALACEVVFHNQNSEDAAILRIQGDLPEEVSTAPISFAQIGEDDPPREASFIYFPPSFIRDDGEPVPVRVNGTVDPVAAPGSYAFRGNTSLPGGALGAGGSGVICDGRLVGLVWQRATENPPFLILRSMAHVLQAKPIRDAIEQQTDLSTRLEYLEPIQVTARTAISEVSSADPSNIQQVAAGTLALNNLYYENVLAQAKSSYKAAAITATIASLLFLSAVFLAITFTRLVPSTLSMVAGAIVAAISGLNFWLFGQTSKQLDSFHVRLERMQRYLVANSVSSGMTESARDDGLRAIVASLCGEIKDESNSTGIRPAKAKTIKDEARETVRARPDQRTHQ